MTQDIKKFGSYETKIREKIEEWFKNESSEKILKKDPWLWTDNESGHEEIRQRLGWLKVHDFKEEWTSIVDPFVQDIVQADFRYVVLLGMGGSSLGPEVLQVVFGNAKNYPELIVLDSTDPRAIQNVERKIGKEKTLYLVASKSGTTIESASLYEYFFDKVSQIEGENAGQYFISVTDPNTALVKTSTDRKHRQIFLNPPDVGGRYSVLTLFGLVPAGLIGLKVDEVLDAVQESFQSVFDDKTPDNPGVALGVSMAVMALENRNKMTLVLPKAWKIFGDWAEQLIAESTGKEGKGIVPIVGEQMDSTQAGEDRYFVALLPKKADISSSLETQEIQDLRQQLDQLSASGHPVFIIEIEELSCIFKEMYRWEIATAIAGAVMRVNPFDQPNVQEAKDQTKAILKEKVAGTVSDAVSKLDSANLNTFSDSKVSICVGDEISKTSGSTGELWNEFWRSVRKNDFLNILAFLPGQSDIKNSLNDLADTLRQKFACPVSVGIGPRYLHSTGQLHKGGMNQGIYLVITSPVQKEQDVAIPGQPYSFQELELAQAHGDFEALNSKSRRVVYIELPDTSSKSFTDLIKFVKDIQV